MRCKCCDSTNVVYEKLEETANGYVWEAECKDCNWYDTGYEF